MVCITDRLVPVLNVGLMEDESCQVRVDAEMTG